MRICKAVVIGFLVSVLGSPVFAADVVKLGYFDLQAVIERSEMGKEGFGKFQEEMKKAREKLETQRQEVKAMRDEFQMKEQVWSEDVKKKKLQQIRVREESVRRAIEQANRDLSERERTILTPLKDKMLEIISRIGKEGGYSMILDGAQAGIAYAPESLNLTDRIIRELNQISAKDKAKQ